jgi:uncharacterized protein (DUF4213/DUF364 family)
MDAASSSPWLEQVREHLAAWGREQGVLDEKLLVRAGELTPEEAIGTPLRNDFPILLGKEKVIEARFQSARGHAFTDMPIEFQGTLGEVLAQPLETNADRALLVATLNGVMRHLGKVSRGVHCRDDEPERCALELAGEIRRRMGLGAVGLIGLNPAILAALVREFGAELVRVTDLNPECIGAVKEGVEIWDGATRTPELIRGSNFVAVTGTTLVNDTFPAILALLRQERCEHLIYGVTAAGVCSIFGFPRFCPYGHDE